MMSVLSAKPDFWFPGFGNDWLEQLHELVIPAELLQLPWWPQGIGVYFVLALAVLVLGRWLLQQQTRWKAKRLQADLLQWLEQTRIEITARPERMAEIPLVLKRFLIFIERGQRQESSGDALKLGEVDWYGLLQLHTEAALSSSTSTSASLSSRLISQNQFKAACRWAYLPPEQLVPLQAEADKFLNCFRQLLLSDAIKVKLIQAVEND